MSDQRSLPTTASFQPAEVERYVNRRIWFQNPVTWFGWVTGILAAGGGFAVIQLWELWMTLAASGGVGVSLVSLANDFRRRPTIRLDYLGELNRQLENQGAELAKWLGTEFASLGNQEAEERLERVQNHMTTFEEVLGHKFLEGSQTYEHFHGAAAALHTQTLNKLKEVATQIKVVGAIDIEGAKRDKDQSRIDLHTGGQRRLSALLSEVDTAIVGLATLKQEIAEIKIGDEDEFKGFLTKVGALANQAEHYRDERAI